MRAPNRISLTAISLLEVLVQPHVWIKLSAPYRVSTDPLATRADPAWVAAILKVAPDRCVWGSDWPHTPPHDQHRGSAVLSPYRSLRYETLVDEFMAATVSEELAERILSDNPGTAIRLLVPRAKNARLDCALTRRESCP